MWVDARDWGHVRDAGDPKAALEARDRGLVSARVVWASSRGHAS